MAIITPADETEPAKNLRSVTPHATSPLPDGTCRSLYVGGAGNVSIVASGDTEAVTIFAVPAGSILPIAVAAVRVTGTNATNIVALY